MLARHALAVAATAATVIVVLSACADEPKANPGPSDSPTATASETPTASAKPEVFTQPTKCAQILSASQQANLESQELVLLGGPEGRYGNEYLLDPTPEQQAGGITCIWGFSDTETSSLTISVAPITAANRAGIVSSLTNQGLNSDVTGGATIFWQQGDTEQEAAIVNVVSKDSWISVIETIGGDVFYKEAVDLTEEVHAQVYAAR
jgi:hypothetical protein